MYAGGRRGFSEMGGMDDPYSIKKQKTDTIWDDAGYSNPNPPTPHFPNSSDNWIGGEETWGDYDSSSGYGATNFSGGEEGFNTGGSNWGGGGGRGRGNRGRGNPAWGRGTQCHFGNSDSSAGLSDDMALLEEAERQYMNDGTVNFAKIKKALQVVSQKSDIAMGRTGGMPGLGRGGMPGLGRGGMPGQGRGGMPGLGTGGMPGPGTGGMPGLGRGGMPGPGRGGVGGNWDHGPGYRGFQNFPGRGGGHFKTRPYDMAPRFGRGNKRGGGRGGSKQGGEGKEDDSQAKSKTIPPLLSFQEQFQRFALIVQNDTQRVNNIQTIENGLAASKLGLKTDYQVEDVIEVCNKMMFTGRLLVGGVFLARSVGANKKDVKYDCFRKAVEVLKTKSVKAIMKMKDVGTEKIREELASLKDEDISNPILEAQKKLSSLEAGGLPPAQNLLDLEGSFKKMIDVLVTVTANFTNAVSDLKHAFATSDCGLSYKYEQEDFKLPDGKLLFKGKLKINNTLMATASGHDKKDTKSKTFERAIEFLKEKPFETIMQGISPVEDDDMPTIEPMALMLQVTPTVPVNLPNEKTLDKLKKLMSKVPEFPGAETVVNKVDARFNQFLLVPICVHRKITGNTNILLFCDLYLDNVLIAVGQGEKIKDAKCDAYTKALEVLSTSTADIIYKDFKRLTEEDIKSTDVVEVWVKGKNKTAESNLQTLRRMKLDPIEHNRRKNQIVVMEHEEWSFDRTRQAFCILNTSATQSALLLEWKVQPIGQFFKCEMLLQLDKVGESCAPGKNAARNLAAADALFNLYQTQPTIKVVSRDDSKFWYTVSTVKEKADLLKSEAGESDIPEEDDLIPVEEEVKKEEDPEKKPAVVMEPLMVNKWQKQVFKQLIEKNANEDSLEEVIFGPGFTTGAKKQIEIFAQQFEQRYASRQNKDATYCSLNKKHFPDKMVEILKRNGGQSGKYSILPKELLPKHADIENLIMSEPYPNTSRQKKQSMDTSDAYGSAPGNMFMFSSNSSFQPPRGSNRGRWSRGQFGGRGGNFPGHSHGWR